MDAVGFCDSRSRPRSSRAGEGLFVLFAFCLLVFALSELALASDTAPEIPVPEYGTSTCS